MSCTAPSINPDFAAVKIGLVHVLASAVCDSKDRVQSTPMGQILGSFSLQFQDGKRQLARRRVRWFARQSGRINGMHWDAVRTACIQY